jgi:hypothetical protein
MMGKRLIALVAALALCAGLAHADKGPSPNNGKGKAKNATVKVEGLVADITDNGDGTATVTIATHPNRAVEVLVNAKTKVEVNEKRATLADVAVGDFVEASVTAAGVATKLDVEADDDD